MSNLCVAKIILFTKKKKLSSVIHYNKNNKFIKNYHFFLLVEVSLLFVCIFFFSFLC